MQEFLFKELRKILLAMFRKDFIGIFHGSISAKIEHNRFFINKKDTIFDDIKPNDFIELRSKKDYRWNEASLDSLIHLSIYTNINEAKYIFYAMPPFTTAYSLDHKIIAPKDYFGAKILGKIPVYDPKQFDDWYERADVEIYRYLKKTNSEIIVIKGYGIYAYDRDIFQLAKKIAILENSSKLLYYSDEYQHELKQKKLMSW